MSRGNSLSDELEAFSVVGDIRTYLGSPQSQKVTFLVTRVNHGLFRIKNQRRYWVCWMSTSGKNDLCEEHTCEEHTRREISDRTV